MVIMFFHSIDTYPLEIGLIPEDSSDDFQPLQYWAVNQVNDTNRKAQSPIANHPKYSVFLNIFNSSTLIEIGSLKSVFKGPGVLASEALYVDQRVLVLQD